MLGVTWASGNVFTFTLFAFLVIYTSDVVM